MKGCGFLVFAKAKRERPSALAAAEERLFGTDKFNVPRSDIPVVIHIA